MNKRQPISDERMSDEIKKVVEESDVQLLCQAMEAAQKSFEQFFEERGLDGAYWQLYLTGYVLASDFSKFKEVRMSLNGMGNEVFQYPNVGGEMSE
jgi:hypothetical protein